MFNFKPLLQAKISITHNNASSIETVFWSESGEKSAFLIVYIETLFTSQNTWVDFNMRDNRRSTFSLEEALLWIMDSYFSQKWQFVSYKHVAFLSSPDVNWWTGVVWIIVMFLSDSHSDGTHSLQSIHCWDTDAVTHFSKPDLILILDGLMVSTFSEHFHFWVKYKLRFPNF